MSIVCYGNNNQKENIIVHVISSQLIKFINTKIINFFHWNIKYWQYLFKKYFSQLIAFMQDS